MGIMLHAVWHGSWLYLWAEQGDWDARAAAKPAANGLVVAHPFAVGVGEMRAMIGEWSSDALLASVAEETGLTLRLPCDERGPISCAGEPRGPVCVAAVAVPALRFPPAEGIDLLLSLPLPLPGECDDSVRYWRRLAQFVAGRLAHRQFYPDVEAAGDGTLLARWRLQVYSEGEIHWLERMAEAMPGSCRAVVDGPAEAGRLVESFLTTTTGCAGSAGGGGGPVFPEDPPARRGGGFAAGNTMVVGASGARSAASRSG